MTLTDFFHDVGCQFQELFWTDAPPQLLEQEIDEVVRRLRPAAAILAAQQGVIRDARQRLGELEDRAAQLSTRIEVYLHVGDQPQAWSQALELDRVRQRITRAREQLQQFRRAHARQQARVDQLREELADLETAGYANS